MKKSRRVQLYEIIFEADTKAGFAFDIALLIAILASTALVILESVQELQGSYASYFYYGDLFFTLLFSIEYALRITLVKRARIYIFSFFGLVDLLAIIPGYLSFFFVGTQYLLVVRALRLLRVFRILKLVQLNKEAQFILSSMQKSRAKISVFLFFILLLCCIIGSAMYLIEGGVNSQFSSIPKSIYWTVVTLTTVGFGDITPQTALGQFFSSLVMILGYAVIAVPTGIVSAEMIRQDHLIRSTQICRNCFDNKHEEQAKYCKSCGTSLEE